MSLLPGNEAQNRLDRSLALPAAPPTSRLTLAALTQFLTASRKTDHCSRTITVEDTVSVSSCAISYPAAQEQNANGSHRRRRGDPQSLACVLSPEIWQPNNGWPAGTTDTLPGIGPRAFTGLLDAKRN